MVDLIAGLIVAIILGLAITYIVKAKKSGQKCIGCPMSKTCSSCGSGSSCHSGENPVAGSAVACESQDKIAGEESAVEEAEEIGDFAVSGSQDIEENLQATFEAYDGEYEYLDENGNLCNAEIVGGCPSGGCGGCSSGSGNGDCGGCSSGGNGGGCSGCSGSCGAKNE